MTLTLLIDLDETLLKTTTGNFIPAYLKLIARYIALTIPPDRMIPTLLAATEEMIKNNRPDRTLDQVFDAAFFPTLNQTRADLMPVFDQFYATVYPELQAITIADNQGVELVEQAFARGYRVAVATNPLFPRTAVLQRLSWAGLPVEKYPFDLISTYETFHFAKPNPAYYAEILAQMGWPEGPIVMVGNDIENDIQPAAALGLYTYLLDGGDTHLENAYPNGKGQLGDLLNWLDGLDATSGPMELKSPAALKAILKATPAALQTMSADLSPEAWRWQPGPDEWGLTEISCHLRDVEMEVNLPRLEKVLTEDNPFIPGMVTDPWAQERKYALQNGSSALRDFTSCRMHALDLLKGLTPEDGQRPARHAIFGPSTIQELVGFTAAHDRTHIQQAYQVFKSISS